MVSASYYVASSIKDDAGVSWIRQLNCALNFGGGLYIGWTKPELSVGSYGINFNVLIPLD